MSFVMCYIKNRLCTQVQDQSQVTLEESIDGLNDLEWVRPQATKQHETIPALQRGNLGDFHLCRTRKPHDVWQACSPKQLRCSDKDGLGLCHWQVRCLTQSA